MSEKQEKSKLISVIVENFTYQFSRKLTLREQIGIGARREEICFGQYGAMAVSVDVGQVSLSIVANRIAQLEIRHTNRSTMSKDFTGFSNLEEVTIEKIWEDFAKQAGLFPSSDEEGNGKKSDTTADSSEGDPE